ncbi:hypothetical protein JP33_07940 [Gallibacterium anatis CCM5995]|uniref:lipopolysaccharide biosynthesis protein n=1 Tax=Gallibacterium anatis TaxID=750 RepID=UPI000532218A|nr:lipopolysaccharide biosynthesis protein [Gallibacterium anatis]KGQ24823.1 hypothetical protein JP33_07940 [Gallibacterium anatis CCM5995]
MTNKSIQNSMRWSLFAEIAAKLVTPISNMLLARILMPEDFGVIAVCTMIVSFVDIITDAGFGKYLIQHDFENKQECLQYATVAFWSNFIISVVLFSFIFLFRDVIAINLGNDSYAPVIAVSSFQIVLTSFSSIQINLLRRQLEYKKLFIIRCLVAVSPLFISVPLAFILKSYWALVFGNLSSTSLSIIVLNAMSTWKPRLFYSIAILRKMLHFSFWSLLEGLMHWGIFWVDVFILAQYYSDYYVGLYKNSSNIVMSILGMISASMSPVLLSVLSRIKHHPEKVYELFLAIQKLMLYLVIPMGVGIFCYQDIVTYILLGSSWSEATEIIGAWGLMMACSVAFYSFTAELYKSQGIPQVLVFFQCLFVAILIPVCIIGVTWGFWAFVYLRCLCVIAQILLSLIFIKKVFGFAVSRLLNNCVYPLLATSSIVIIYVLSREQIHTKIAEFITMIVSACAYFAVVYLFFRKDVIRQQQKIVREKIND